MDSVEFARLVVDSLPLAAVPGIDVTELSPQQVGATMDWAEERCTTGGILRPI